MYAQTFLYTIMQTKILRVVSQTEAVYVTSKKQENGQVAKGYIKLKELGGDYEDEYTCTVFGNLALVKFDKGDTVVAVLQFRTREANGAMYQDVVAKDIVKVKG